MKPPPQKYRTTNWKAYNAALKSRGSLLIWLDPTMNWHGQASDKRGRSPTFSDQAIQFCLSIKCLFNLPLRQAMEWPRAFCIWQGWAGLTCAGLQRGKPASKAAAGNR